MKVARFVLKIVAVSLTVAAIACAVVAYWDKIVECFQAISDRITEKKASLHPAEYDDYAE